ncbi:MAG: TonB-dependent receptor [Myxococcales bacterium FL481]|nr:MAG: TonB-dependent receptor [Myxococcales bacterium FL481]
MIIHSWISPRGGLFLLSSVAAGPFAPALAHAASLSDATQSPSDGELPATEDGAARPTPGTAGSVQSPTGEGLEEEERTIMVGSRRKPRTNAKTPAPVDVLTAEDLESTGAKDIGTAMQRLAPSFNLSSNTISDGSDLLRPATLRGLGPDQVLVLVNGKRRHQTALVHVQDTVGKGAAGYDLNAIPVSAVERVEVLRDGAAAVYGSDAIAGVINIVLKDRKGFAVYAEAGRNYAEDTAIHGEANARDSIVGLLDRFSAGVNVGVPLGDRGTFSVSVDYREIARTNRATVADLPDDPDTPEDEAGQLIGDWRDENGNPVVRLWVGQAWMRSIGGFYNADFRITPTVSVYSFGGISRRWGRSHGFFRGPGHRRVPLELYPQGFLPTLLTQADDISALGGLKVDLSDRWKMDLSAGYGRSQFRLGSRNSVNVSWFYEINPDTGEPYLDSPTSAHDGTLSTDTLTANADFSAYLDAPWKRPILFGTGVAFRQDGYQIQQGDRVSWSYGRADDKDVSIVNTSLPVPDVAEAGIQGFPGYRPDTEVDDKRPSLAAYLDAETDLHPKWLLSAAGRVEAIDFRDIALVGKLATRYDPARALSLRGSVSNGFRAPAVQQIFYSQELTAIAGGTLVDVGTVPNGSALAENFGVRALEPERSFSGSAGFVFKPDIWLPKPTKALTLTSDFYLLKIWDRIILSEMISGDVPDGDPANDTEQLMEIRTLLADADLGAAQFFTNGVDTTTIGADIVGIWELEWPSFGLDLQGALGLVKTEVDAINSQSSLIEDDALFSPTQQLRLEKGQPRRRAVVSALAKVSDFGFRVAGNHFGPVSGMAYTGVEHEWSGKWLTDASVYYAPSALDGFRVTIGGTNIFDVYPDEWTTGGIFRNAGFKYGWETLPFGINGGYYYLSLSFATY